MQKNIEFDKNQDPSIDGLNEEGHAAPADWRQNQLGRLLGHAMRRFDARVLELMAHDPQVPLALSNLAARDKVSAAHIHITRHLSIDGARLSDLAQAAGMSKQAMAQLVEQCAAWGLVDKAVHSVDRRAKKIFFTEVGLQWLAAFKKAVHQAEGELKQEIGDEVAVVLKIGLEIYANNTNNTQPKGAP